jgi:hypothetical protein
VSKFAATLRREQVLSFKLVLLTQAYVTIDDVGCSV